jgi:hypothetical protein
MFKKRKRPTKQPAVVVVPRVAIVQALALAEYDGNAKASAAARRLLAAIDDSPNDYLAL